MSLKLKLNTVVVRSIFLCFLVLVLVDSSSGQTTRVEYEILPQDIVETRMRAVVRKNAERQQMLRKFFEEAGCAGGALTEQIRKEHLPPNVVCKLDGSSESTIIVGAHSDNVMNGGMGAVDDWSGAAILPTLYQSLRGKLRKHTFLFVGFADEEEGLMGSKFFVKSMTKEQIQITKAMVNLECLGLGPTKVWVNHADQELLGRLLKTAKYLKLSLTGVNIDQVGKDDAMSFAERGIPTITIHTVTQDTFPILHTLNDNIKAMNMDAYYENYRLICVYLAYLDSTLQ